jgi:hypothetical protein
VATKLLETSFSPSAIQAAVSLVNSQSAAPLKWTGSYLTADLSDTSARFGVPAPYGLKGGAARVAARIILTGQHPLAPRDLDLVRTGSHRTPQDDVIAAEFMPADYMHGARVELVSSLERYFATRDITVNESAIIGSTVQISLLGALDTLGYTLRPSRYRGGTLHKPPQLSGRIVLKMLRLRSEGALQSEPWQLLGIPEQVTLTDFDLALHLDKAFQRGQPVAEDFLDLCARLQLIPYTPALLQSTLQELAHLAVGERALLRNVPKELLPVPPACV